MSLKATENSNKDLFIPEYYDKTGIFQTHRHITENCQLRISWHFIQLFADFETILTSVELERHDKKTFKLTSTEKSRIEKILQRAVDKEEGKLDESSVSISEDNPDGRK